PRQRVDRRDGAAFRQDVGCAEFPLEEHYVALAVAAYPVLGPAIRPSPPVDRVLGGIEVDGRRVVFVRSRAGGVGIWRQQGSDPLADAGAKRPIHDEFEFTRARADVPATGRFHVTTIRRALSTVLAKSRLSI